MPKRINIFLEVLAVVSFALTLYLLWQDRTSSAGVAVALSFGAVLFRVLPSLESFEILGLKAKLRERIEEADDILEKVRRIASTITKTAVLNTTWANRIGGLSYTQKAELLEQQARELAALGVAPEIIDDVKHPALAMISRDLASCFIRSLEQVLRPYCEAYGRVRGDLARIPEESKPSNHAAMDEYAKSRQASYSHIDYQSNINSLHNKPESLFETLQKIISSYRLSEIDQKNLIKIANRLSDINTNIWKKNMMTEEAGHFLDEYRGVKLFHELYPDGPNGPDWDVTKE